MLRPILRWLDRRVGVSSGTGRVLAKVFPDHWTFLLGEAALYCFVILVATGVFLTFFFVPSSEQVVYDGAYGPAHGLVVSKAYASTLDLSFGVRAGLLVRQVHHWAALLFVVVIAMHAARIFFTGAFRRPRELNWMIGLTLLVLAMANGFTGYSLPDDLLGGTGLRIGYSFVLSVPVVGTWLAYLFFGGEFPAEEMIPRLFILHVLIVPALIAGLLGAHLVLVWRQTHTQFPGRYRREGNVVGRYLWPTYATKSAALFCALVAGLAALGGLVQVNPVWLYGPFDPMAVTIPAQPIWFLGWVEGALRLLPAARLTLFGYEVPHQFFAGVLLPGVVFTTLYLWPFLEARATGDRDEHHLAGHPSDHPVRTALGVAGLAFLGALLAAASNDIQAAILGISVVPVTNTYRVLVFALPAALGPLAWKVCRDRARNREGEPSGDGERAPLPSWPGDPGAGAVGPPVEPEVPAGLARGRTGAGPGEVGAGGGPTGGGPVEGGAGRGGAGGGVVEGVGGGVVAATRAEAPRPRRRLAVSSLALCAVGVAGYVWGRVRARRHFTRSWR